MIKDTCEYITEGLSSPDDNRDYKYKDVTYNVVDLTKTIDYRPWLQPIRDQNSQGSCVACSASTMKEWQESNDIGLSEGISPQFLYNLRENYPDGGMWSRDILHILKDIGAVLERDYPYAESLSPTSITDKLRKLASNFKIDGYARISTLLELQTALRTNGPCLIMVPVYNSCQPGRIWAKMNDSDVRGLHCMTVVGDDVDKQQLMIRNSWGLGFNDKGYCYMPYSDWSFTNGNPVGQCIVECWTTIDSKSARLGRYIYANSYIKKILAWILKLWYNKNIKQFIIMFGLFIIGVIASMLGILPR